MSQETLEQEKEQVGFVYQSLQRNNKQIRADRAEALAEDLETPARRACEDLYSDLRKATRDRAAMYDFSPANTQSLVLAKDVDGRAVWKDDMAKSLEIRDLQIKFEIACARYKDLYGKEFNGVI